MEDEVKYLGSQLGLNFSKGVWGCGGGVRRWRRGKEKEIRWGGLQSRP